jgi:hypothetical protein
VETRSEELEYDQEVLCRQMETTANELLGHGSHGRFFGFATRNSVGLQT